MKRLAAGLLALVMVISVAACGGNMADSSVVSDPVSGPVQSAPAESVPAVDVPAEEVNEPEKTAEPTFDTAWAQNEFEKLLPQPPFTGWIGEQTGEHTYEMETGEANKDESGTYYDTFADYVNALSEYGFTIEVIGEGYLYNACDANGNTFEFKCGDGWCWITINKLN